MSLGCRTRRRCTMALPRVMTRIRDPGSLAAQIPSLPEKWKGGRVERLANYLANVGRDYSESFQELFKGARNRPRKAVAICSVLGLGYYMYHHNPDEMSFRDKNMRNNIELSLIHDDLRNPASRASQNAIARLYNGEEFRLWSLGLFSIVWRDNFSQHCGHAMANCEYTKVGYLNFWDRIVDVGAFDRWWFANETMKDFDINPNDWNEDGSPKEKVILGLVN